MLIRPLLPNASVLVLFLLPMITMRTYSEEKRSGTIELLLTSPLTDLEIIVGKFLGALGLYAAMLAVTAPHVAILFYYGNPEWRPLVSGYLGLSARRLLRRDGAVHLEHDQELVAYAALVHRVFSGSSTGSVRAPGRRSGRSSRISRSRSTLTISARA